jgi:hypothetical protein
VVALISPAWLASPWCFFELRQARFLGKAVFPVRIAACESGPILGDIQEGDLVSDPEARHRQLWEGLRRAGLDPATMLHYDSSRPPYPGLQALQEADAAVFFGRDDDISADLELRLPRASRDMIERNSAMVSSCSAVGTIAATASVAVVNSRGFSGT